jgi:hypothetical protein
VVINASSRLAFFTGDCNILAMASGMWIVLVIPAIIAFVFGAWVLYGMMIDVSEREVSPNTERGMDSARTNIEPGG